MTAILHYISVNWPLAILCGSLVLLLLRYGYGLARAVGSAAILPQGSTELPNIASDTSSHTTAESSSTRSARSVFAIAIIGAVIMAVLVLAGIFGRQADAGSSKQNIVSNDAGTRNDAGALPAGQPALNPAMRSLWVDTIAKYASMHPVEKRDVGNDHKDIFVSLTEQEKRILRTLWLYQLRNIRGFGTRWVFAFSASLKSPELFEFSPYVADLMGRGYVDVAYFDNKSWCYLTDDGIRFMLSLGDQLTTGEEYLVE